QSWGNCNATVLQGDTGQMKRLQIGMDCQALQSRGSKNRGIGVFTHSMLHELTRDPSVQYHFFLNSWLELPCVTYPGVFHTIEYIQPVDGHNREANEYIQRLAYEGQDLDLLHIASPMEGADAVICGFETRTQKVPLVCTLYDLIPLVMQD